MEKQPEYPKLDLFAEKLWDWSRKIAGGAFVLGLLEYLLDETPDLGFFAYVFVLSLGGVLLGVGIGLIAKDGKKGIAPAVVLELLSVAPYAFIAWIVK